MRAVSLPPKKHPNKVMLMASILICAISCLFYWFDLFIYFCLFVCLFVLVVVVVFVWGFCVFGGRLICSEFFYFMFIYLFLLNKKWGVGRRLCFVFGCCNFCCIVLCVCLVVCLVVVVLLVFIALFVLVSVRFFCAYL